VQVKTGIFNPHFNGKTDPSINIFSVVELKTENNFKRDYVCTPIRIHELINPSYKFFSALTPPTGFVTFMVLLEHVTHNQDKIRPQQPNMLPST
jgi:hypothetical protein